MDIAKLYIQNKVLDWRREDTTNLKKEIEDAFEKVQNRYSDHEMMPEERLDYNKM
jgi:hypothetical protein